MEYGKPHEINEFSGIENNAFGDVPDVVIVADDTEVSETTNAPVKEVNQPSDATLEAAQLPTTATVRIESVSKIKEGDTSAVLNAPRESHVTAAARQGETQVVTITRDGQSQPIQVEVSPSLVPPRATVSQTPKKESAEATEEPSKFVAWTRIVAEQRPQTDDSSRTPNQGTSRLDIEGLLPELKGPFQIKIVAEGVPEAAHVEIMGDVADMVHDAKQSSTGGHHAAKLEDFQGRLSDARDTALVRRTIVVGVQDPADLDSVARTVANAGFRHNGQVSWRPEVDARGRVVSYGSETSALKAGENDADAFISAEQFTKEVQYPANSVPGYGVKPHESFATNREVPEGAKSIAVGRIIDNNGDLIEGPKGELRVTDKDLGRHGIIAASSGGGKTVLIRQIATGAVQASYERSRQSEMEGVPDNNRAVVIVDFEKIGNYSDKLADQLAGAGVPEEHATVRVISPGGDGVRANVNLLRLNGSTPSEQIATAVKALTNDMGDPEAVRVFEKFASMAMEKAYTKLGWNMTTDKAKYPNGTPPTPDMEQVAIAIEEVLSETNFQGTTKGDLGSFTESTLRQALRGVPGQLFQGGYDIDWNKVIASKGVTVIELGRITDLNARRVAMTGIFRGLAQALKVANPGGGDVDHSKLLLVMDETGGIFDGDTESGRDNARVFTHIRGQGGNLLIAQQGKMAKLDANVTDNTGNFWGLQMNSAEDREIAAKRMSIETPTYLANVSEGRGLYHGRNMEEGPVRFTTPSPESIPLGQGKVTGAETLLDKGTDTELYSGEVKALARDVLKTGEVGAMVRGWVEINTALTLTGRDTAKISGDLKAQLQSMSGADATVRDCAITMAVDSAIDSRPELRKVMDPAGLKDYLIKEALAQVTGETPPEKAPLDFVLDEGRYSAVKDMLVEATTAPRLADSARYEKAFFGEESTRKVGGATAEEQLDNLKNLERASLKAAGEAVESLAKAHDELVQVSNVSDQQLANLLDPGNDAATLESSIDRVSGMDKQDLQDLGANLSAKFPGISKETLANMSTLQNEVAKFVGTGSATEALVTINAGISQALKRPLSPNELEIVATIAGSFDYREPADRTLGYSDMRNALNNKIQEAKLAPALDLTEMEERYGERFDVEGEGPAQLAQHQLAAIETKERQLLANSPDKITMSNILFAPDLIKGGQTLDNVVATFVSDTQEKGVIYDAFRRTTAGGRQEGHTLVEMLARSDPLAAKWGEELGKRLLLGRQLTMPVSSSRYLVRWFAGHITKLTNMAKDRKGKA